MNLLARALMAQANSEAVENSIGGICAYRITEFLRMNPLEFSGSKVEEDPNGFIKEVYKTLAIMRLTSREKVELAAYQLKDVNQVWYEQRKDYSLVGAAP